MIFGPATLEVNPALAPVADWSDLIDAQYLAHLEAEADDAYWAEQAQDAALDAAWDRACEIGYLPC